MKMVSKPKGALPCPFCGSRRIYADDSYLNIDAGSFASVICEKCEATGPGSEDEGNIEQAIAAWNKAKR